MGFNLMLTIVKVVVANALVVIDKVGFSVTVCYA
jgi:hypothetical protein